MQIYTRVLLGMGVGAVIGLALGPSSPLLPKDSYRVRDPSTLQLYRERGEAETAFSLPEVKCRGGSASCRRRGLDLRFEILDTLRERRADATGRLVEVPTWSRVRFPYTEQMGLLDSDGALRRTLGNPGISEPVTAWLRIESAPVPGGGFSTWPEPVSGLGDTVIIWLRPLGALFMRLIKMVIVPLVFSSLLVGVASLGDVRKLGRLGGKTLVTYIVTTALAVTIGLVSAKVINPGSFMDEVSKTQLQAQFQGEAGSRVEDAAQAPSAIDNILEIVPENPLESLSSGNMLQIIFFALIFGIALTLLDDKHGRPVVTFFDRVQDAMVVIIHIVMAVAPFGVAALVAEVVGTSGLSVLASLLVYGLTVLVGLAVHATFVYGGLLRFFVRMRARDFLRAVRPAQLIAFSTSSSSATLPVTMECAEGGLGVSNSVSSFVLPLGSTVNMDGTALYQGVAAIFIAQVFQMHLSLGAQVGIVLTATMASIGAAGVPGAGMVTLAMVLTAAGIPAVGVALILGMDRLLDMFRTAVNVTGDLTVAAAMAVSEGETLKILTPEGDAADPSRGFERRLDHAPQPVEPEE